MLAPIRVGILGPYTSASIKPTRAPSFARAMARFALTVDFPTPPFPLATGTTFFTNGTSLSFSADWVARTCEVMVMATCVMPGSESTTRRASSCICSRTGHAGVVNSIVKATFSPSIRRPLMNPSDTMSRWMSGSLIVANALRTACSVTICLSLCLQECVSKVTDVPLVSCSPVPITPVESTRGHEIRLN